MTFTVPATTNPPNLPQWRLAMAGTVWVDDSVSSYALYPVASPTGTPVYSSGPVTLGGPTAGGTFRLDTWVNPNEQYTLAFTIAKTANSITGFRLRFTECHFTPEPGSWVLMLSAGAGLLFAGWRRRKVKKPQA